MSYGDDHHLRTMTHFHWECNHDYQSCFNETMEVASGHRILAGYRELHPKFGRSSFTQVICLLLAYAQLPPNSVNDAGMIGAQLEDAEQSRAYLTIQLATQRQLETEPLEQPVIFRFCKQISAYLRVLGMRNLAYSRGFNLYRRGRCCLVLALLELWRERNEVDDDYLLVVSTQQWQALAFLAFLIHDTLCTGQ
ncbi:uncharacterized protein B0I36DRAFT_15007 [Microdochium trichocladiopsis]|uniref:Uncharacterized protein n=1 Tax=Microdochium trichocladiopsis TaxID=1682393 RepID=A0A9P8YIX1_9PEZI|nr:uncharacterized protein B0I36DRAFT_15007 [Microdochium trichocladiopsis]KAH7040758.1 hypothetical protein B0I36DRAFT_15007 [Microdochium trichocladiopsis]